MGLDAVVYGNRVHLRMGSDEELAQLLPETGEVYFQNDELSRKYGPQLEAAAHRLGNVTEIAELREEVIRFVPPNIQEERNARDRNRGTRVRFRQTHS